jgi:uncharacterized protein (DUF2267 family)
VVRSFTDGDRVGSPYVENVTEISIIERSTESAHVWLKELAEELGTTDRQEAYRALRACLHALRDRLPIDEAAQFAAQLPTLIRGVYYEDWDPSKTPVRYRGPADLLSRVAAEARLDGETEASYALSATMQVVRRHVSAGELEDIQAVFPAELRTLLH